MGALPYRGSCVFRRARWRTTATAFVAMLSFSGCAASDGPTIAVEVIDPAGGNPVAAGGFDRIVVDLEVGGATTSHEAPIVAGGFELPVLFESLEAPQRFSVRLEGPSESRWGASPTFVPASSGGLIRLPVLRQGECDVLTGVALSSPRRAAGLARLDTFLLVVGGVDSTGDVAGGQFIDLLRAEAGGQSDAGGALGMSAAVGLGSLAALALGQTGRVVFFDFTVEPASTTTLALHDGATAGATLVRVGDRALIVGGSTGGVAVAEASSIDAAGVVTPVALQAARRLPAAASVGEEAWIAGGSMGGMSLERIDAAGSSALDPSPASEARFGGWLAVDLARGLALLFGGVDELGALRNDSVLFSGCPAACVASPGPTWTQARLGATFAPAGRLIVGGAGPSAMVERVVFSASGASFETAALLTVPRQEAAARFIEGGVLWVVGGEAANGPRDDVEICFVGP